MTLPGPRVMLTPRTRYRFENMGHLTGRHNTVSSELFQLNAPPA